MIRSWNHVGIKKFFITGNKSGITASHEKRLKIILQRLNAAAKPEDMNTPGMKFHKLVGNLKGYYAVTVNASWRIIFRFDGIYLSPLKMHHLASSMATGIDAIDIDYVDYH